MLRFRRFSSMISSKLLSLTMITLMGVFPSIYTGGFSTQVNSAQRFNVIRSAAVQGQIDKIAAKGMASTAAFKAQPPGLSDLRVTYKLARSDIYESSIEATQTIDDHWCVDFNLPAAPFGCSCWRYEYMAYFCIDWSCANGRTSDFAMCQFLNVTWPVDPPRRPSQNDVGKMKGKIQSVLEILAGYLPVKRAKDTSLAMKLLRLLSLGQNLQKRGGGNK